MSVASSSETDVWIARDRAGFVFVLSEVILHISLVRMGLVFPRGGQFVALCLCVYTQREGCPCAQSPSSHPFSPCASLHGWLPLLSVVKCIKASDRLRLWPCLSQIPAAHAALPLHTCPRHPVPHGFPAVDKNPESDGHGVSTRLRLLISSHLDVSQNVPQCQYDLSH
ncbi:hypothetical protein IRJ41_009690 [Triplophysa rosa]|uniref:Uncharacterized protein n=1 Tax=Triplophysa rosa TaxID=992332 RepID=A0A9W7TG90_TRIRA|nr:hypothetical protein IRJ41_009690 [Triplophysa rosa]